MPAFSKSASDTWIGVVLSIGLGIVVAVAFYFIGERVVSHVANADVLLAVTSATVGSVVTLVTSVLCCIRKIESVEETFTELLHFVNDKHCEAHDIAMLARYGSVDIRADQMSEAWTTLLWKMSRTFSATSNVHISKQNVKRVYPTVGLEIQFAKVADGLHVERLFIIEADSEIADVAALIKNQLDNGVRCAIVRWHEVKDRPDVRVAYNALRTYGEITKDFGILDNKYLFLWTLNKNRELVGGRIVFQNEMREKYDRFFATIKRHSTDGAHELSLLAHPPSAMVSHHDHAVTTGPTNVV